MAEDRSEDTPTKKSAGDDELLEEIRETYTDYINQWTDTHEQGRLDMQALSVDGPWPEAERKARQSVNNPRPCEHIDIISQYPNRLVNQARQNKRGIKIVPTGDGADDKSAELREGRIRQIEYESKAVRARLTALQNAAERGYGFYRVRTDYINPRSSNQRIIIDRIPNPDSVLVDPYCKEADFSDQDKSFIVDRFSREAFVRKFGKRAKIRSFETQHLSLASQWVDDKSVMVAEFWKREKEIQQLLTFNLGPQTVNLFKDEIKQKFPESKVENQHVFIGGQWWPIQRERESETCQVMQYLTNGVEILDKNEWLGSTIPILVVIGREKYENGKRVIESLTRKLRAPQLGYDVAYTNQVETMGLVPKSKFIVYEGQVEEFPEWEDAHKTPRPYLRVKAQVDATGTNLLPKPDRIDYDPPIQAMELAKNSSIQAAQNAVGMSATERIDRVAKSGIAQERIDQSTDIASYHVIDNLDLAIEREGTIVNELLHKIEDSERTVGTRKADDTYQTVRLQPTAESHPYGPGDSHSVTVQAGPSYQSQRDQANDFADKLVATDPQVFSVIGDLVVKLKDLGPIGDQIAERLQFLLPPALQQKMQGQQPVPPQAQQQIAQLQQALQVASQQLQKFTMEKQAKTQELDARAQIQAYSDDVKLAVAELQAKTKMDAESLSAWMTRMDQTLQQILQEREHAHQMATAALQPPPMQAGATAGTAGSAQPPEATAG